MTAPLAMITGAAGGIGAALVARLAEDGWRLHLVDQNLTGLRALAGKLGDQCSWTQSKLGSLSACQNALPEGKIDALVHLAGVFTPDDMPVGERAVYDDMQHANAATAYDLTGAAAERIGPGGKIVLASSLAFNRGAASYVAYSMAKGAVVGLTRALARKLGARDICVNAVAPGIIETSMTTDMIAQRGSANILNEIPLARLGTPEDVAGAIRFLISKDAAYITGQVLNIDGGIVNG
ncbi:MAG: SDR family oxidoreductase [Pseudomonadota bacterium]